MFDLISKVNPMSRDRRLDTVLADIENAAQQSGLAAADTTAAAARQDTARARLARQAAADRYRSAQVAAAESRGATADVTLAARVAVAEGNQAIDDATAALAAAERAELAGVAGVEDARRAWRATVGDLAREAMRLATAQADGLFAAAVEANATILRTQAVLNAKLGGYAARQGAVPDAHWADLSAARLESWRQYRCSNGMG